MRVLLLLGQSVHDHSSGAAQSMRQMAEALAFSGCEVRALCTTGCENGADASHWWPAWHRREGGLPGIDPSWSAGDWIELTDRGVLHHALVTEPDRRHHWQKDHGAAFDARLDALVDAFEPEVVLTFGADLADQARWQKLRQRGARVVLVLHNLHQADQPRPQVDACWVPSRFMQKRYRLAWPGHAAPTVVPTPLAPYLRAADLNRADRVFVTFINPEPAKGVAVAAGLLHRWLATRPQQPLLVVEGRSRADQWLQALRTRGLHAGQCAQAFVSPTREDLADVWASSRVLLMPSVVEEAAGRVALEAMLNGVVPVVSNRGALPETVGEPRWVQPLPPEIHWRDTTPAGDEVCAAWDAAVSHWLDDEADWLRASRQAMAMAEQHLPDRVGPIYRRELERLFYP